MKKHLQNSIIRIHGAHRKLLRIPAGLAQQIDEQAKRIQLTPDEWIVSACFEKLRRDLFRKHRKNKILSKPKIKTTPDFFYSILKRRYKQPSDGQDR